MAASLAVMMTGFGCASVAPEDTDAWRASQRPALTERAGARWAALIKGDLASAYGYLTPAYRDVVSLQQYMGRVGNVVDWRLARVRDVRYDSPTVASVTMEVTYKYALPGAGDVLESVRLLDEKWQYKQRDWWYISK